MSTLLAAVLFVGMASTTATQADPSLPSPSPTSDAARPAVVPDGHSDYDTPPIPVRITQPRYPAEPFHQGISGTVEIEILIDTQGRVSKAKVVKSIPELDAAALDCVRNWVFRPAMKGGQPVATVASAPITFKITMKKDKKKK
jgi:TonB family protein